jgi:hypothetical protein
VKDERRELAPLKPDDGIIDAEFEEVRPPSLLSPRFFAGLFWIGLVLLNVWHCQQMPPP